MAQGPGIVHVYIARPSTRTVIGGPVGWKIDQALRLVRESALSINVQCWNASEP